jgi:hypothetical protein
MAHSQTLDTSNPRYWRQNAQMAVRDVYDAVVEVVTNADDRYQVLRRDGRIEIEVERRRKESSSTLRVRDFADGMTAEVMKSKLAKLGGRISGLAEGESVRGTNSRGAKDIAVLGGVVFESIAADGRYHRCEISPQGQFTLADPSPRATERHRDSIGIPEGTGTVVTVSVDPNVTSVPQHETMRDQLASLIPLRDILSSPQRTVTLLDVNKQRKEMITAHEVQGREVLKERILVPGYPEIEAKLVVKRASDRFEPGKAKFRRGGIAIKSSHAIHEATLFAPEFEHDPHAAWFFGRLTCEGIDRLGNDYDERFEKGKKPTADNPRPVLDPMRTGLSREHPFVKALFGEALKRFRPLVDAERRQADSTKPRIESDQTRKRLRSLEKEATKFIDRYLDEDETPRDADDKNSDNHLRGRGFSFSPPFAQIVVEHKARFWLNISSSAFPELAVGDPAELTCSSSELICDRRVVLLEQHPKQEGILRAVWSVKAVAVTPAIEVAARAGSVVGTSTVEVLQTEREKFAWVTELCLDAKRYQVRVGSSRTVRLLAPFPGVISAATDVEVHCSDKSFSISGEKVLRPRPELGVAVCKLRLTGEKPDKKALVTLKVVDKKCEAEVVSRDPLGTSISIKLENVDHVNQRSRWRGAVLEIAAKHPSVSRYLGPFPDFAGQEERHFRVLLAEIVAEAVCSLLISKNAESRPGEYAEYDWDAYYADYTKLMTEFLPIAHESQVKDPL